MIHTITSNKCICCDEQIVDGVTLHRTRRQTHRLCDVCAIGYIGPLLDQSLCNIKQMLHTEIPTIKCPGTYHSEQRNHCSHVIYISDLEFNYNSPLLVKAIRMLDVVTSPNLMFCPQTDCPNVVDIHPDDYITHTQCTMCMNEWCRNCKVSPYHHGKTCLEYEIEIGKTENGIAVASMIADGTLNLCPTCKAPTTKQKDSDGGYVGCNKIVCVSCGVKWCWLCQETNIDYSHFNSEGVNPCSNRLWEGTII